MYNLNNIVDLTGNVGMPVKYGTNGTKSYSKIQLGVKSGTNSNSEFFQITCFGVTATNAHKYIAVGDKIRIHGRLQKNTYTDKDGVTRYNIEIIANVIDYVRVESMKNIKKDFNNPAQPKPNQQPRPNQQNLNNFDAPEYDFYIESNMEDNDTAETELPF